MFSGVNTSLPTKFVAEFGQNLFEVFMFQIQVLELMLIVVLLIQPQACKFSS